MTAPDHVHDYKILEWGSFGKPRLPTGYSPPIDGRLPLKTVQHVAVCQAPRVEGYYTIFCTADWEFVTFAFNDTLEAAKQTCLLEFAEEISQWHQKA